MRMEKEPRTDKLYVRNSTKMFLVLFIYVLGIDISMTDDLRKIFLLEIHMVA